MSKSHDLGTDVRGNIIELHGVVICNVLEIVQDFVIAYINENVRGRTRIAEFNENIRPGIYFEAEIADINHDGVPDLVKPEIIPSYDIKPYSFVRAEVTFLRRDMAILRINKYRFAKMQIGEIDGDDISVGDIVEAEVVIPHDDEGYSMLGWGRIVEKAQSRIPKGKFVEKDTDDKKDIEKATASDNLGKDGNVYSDQQVLTKEPSHEKKDILIIHIPAGTPRILMGDYELLPFDGKLSKYTDKNNVVRREIPLAIDGKTKYLPVYVEMERRILYIAMEIYKLYGDKLIQQSKASQTPPKGEKLSKSSSEGKPTREFWGVKYTIQTVEGRFPTDIKNACVHKKMLVPKKNKRKPNTIYVYVNDKTKTIYIQKDVLESHISEILSAGQMY